MKWNDKDRTLTINDRQGNYKGMLKIVNSTLSL